MIDKNIYAAPQGLEEDPTASAIEIEIEDPEAVRIGIDGMEIELTPGAKTEEDFNANLAEFMDEGELDSLASTLRGDIDNDLNSRKDWEETYKEGLKLLGLKYEERTEPWEGASGVFHPMITEAVVRFQSETIMETFPAQGPVKTRIIGHVTPEKEEAAARVQEDMNYELTENMVEFRPEHEKMLWNLCPTGSAFKKVYEDPALGRQTSVFVPAEDVILPYGMTDMQTSPRVTHCMRMIPNDLKRMQLTGFYRDIDIPEPTNKRNSIQEAKDKETGFTADFDTRYVLYEVVADLDLPGYEDTDKDGSPTGLALPYILTMDDSGKVLAIRRNWREDDELKRKRQHFVHYQYIPGFGSYGFGLFHLIGGFAKSATSLMRQLVDAGTLSNLPGGLKSRGLRIKGDDTPISPGEWRDVDVGSGPIRDNILPLPYKEPSATLYQLLGNIVEEGRRFAATSDIKISDMSNQAPVGSTLAILERTLKVMSAVQARVHYSLKQELRLIADILKDNSACEGYEYDVEAPMGRKAKMRDYSMVDIIPVSDPNAATMSQRVVQYQAVIQMAQMAPQIYDLPQLHRQMLQVLGIKNVEKLIPTEDDHKPVDPVTENQNLLVGKPVKAFAYQDHEAHILVHRAAMQDPVMAQLMGQNPQAGAIQQAAMAHMSEHMGYAYRNKMQMALGIPLPDAKDGLEPDLERQLSKMLAQAAPKVAAGSQALVAQQQAQQNAQDPLIQMQMQDQQLKAQEQQRKAQKDQMDYQIEQQKLALEQQRLQLNARNDTARLQLDMEKLDADTGHKVATHDMAVSKEQNAAAAAEQERIMQGIMRRMTTDENAQAQRSNE